MCDVCVCIWLWLCSHPLQRHSPLFAAPEVMRAMESGDSKLLLSQSQDVFSLGMVAYKLLHPEGKCK